jgi:hypothetical protein
VLVVPDGLLGARLERLLGCRARHQGRHGLLPLVFMQQRSELRRFGLLRILLQLDARFPAEARARRAARPAPRGSAFAAFPNAFWWWRLVSVQGVC